MINGHTHTCTACLSYRDMEFMAEGRDGSDTGLPLVDPPCWFCSPFVSMTEMRRRSEGDKEDKMKKMK